MKAKISLHAIFVMVLTLLLSGVTGCSRSNQRTDAQVAGDVQAKISADSTLTGRQISINANKGVVTLAGTVNSDAERVAATNDAAQVDGVKQVLNNLQLAPAEAAAPVPENTQVGQSEPTPEPKAAQKPRPTRRTSNRPSPSQSSSSSVTTRD